MDRAPEVSAGATFQNPKTNITMETPSIKIKRSKAQNVKRHLMQRGSITSWDAIKLYNLTRLAVVINRLRKLGWVISTEMINTPDGVRYATYRLVARPE